MSSMFESARNPAIGVWIIESTNFPRERIKQMLLAIDVGNTNTVIGVFDGKKQLGIW